MSDTLTLDRDEFGGYPVAVGDTYEIIMRGRVTLLVDDVAYELPDDARSTVSLAITDIDVRTVPQQAAA